MTPITIYTMAFNEETVIQFMLSHYKTRFPNAKIILRDNCSTDNTVKIAKENDCEVLLYDTNGIHDDFSLQNLKNNCWKNASTDWVLICDPDELLHINEEQLEIEAISGSTIIKTEGYDMINIEDNFNLHKMQWGVRDKQYDKLCLFNKKHITDINYHCGAHISNPIGNIKYSDLSYKNCHYNWINPEYLIARYAITAARISAKNKQYGMGSYNLQSAEEVRKSFHNKREQLKKEGIKVL